LKKKGKKEKKEKQKSTSSSHMQKSQFYQLDPIPLDTSIVSFPKK